MDIRRNWVQGTIQKLLLIPAVMLIGVLVTASLWAVLTESLTDPFAPGTSLTLIHYRRVLSMPYFWRNTFFSLILALSASFISTAVGVATAYLITTTKSAILQRMSEKIMQTGLIIPFIYVIFLAFLFLSQAGILSRVLLAAGFISDIAGFPALIFDTTGIGMLVVFLFKGIPFVTLMTLVVMTRINRQYHAVAETLGAHETTQFLRIYLPLSRSVVLWSSMVLFAYALGSFEVPHLLSAFQPQPHSALLYSLYVRPSLDSLSESMALGILLLVMAVPTAAAYAFLLNRWLKGGAA